MGTFLSFVLRRDGRANLRISYAVVSRRSAKRNCRVFTKRISDYGKTELRELLCNTVTIGRGFQGTIASTLLRCREAGAIGQSGVSVG